MKRFLFQISDNIISTTPQNLIALLNEIYKTENVSWAKL